MTNIVQLDRYNKLLSYLNENFKEDINIEKVELICHYSYRNINRIFEALHHETIGKYVKRLRLEKAAQYLKYSNASVSAIAYEVGFEDRAAFSKAFKKKYNYAPSAFRESSEKLRQIAEESILQEEDENRQKLQFEIEFLPTFDYLFFEYRGDYEDYSAIEAASDTLYQYVKNNNIISDRSIFMTEIMDDSDISDNLHLRYNVGFILEQPLQVKLDGLFRTKVHKRQKYVKFCHKGTYHSHSDYYNKIYALWMLDVALELADLPTLEFYPNADQNNTTEETLIEIYIPIL
ncbi:GyrI-like domain-containing protein [Flammeovirga sp. OC4]|uniref:AraC family transcriptional regulator n=1 Tax=Flammeovirga sp. OC4 TaxID=1382345 RepID=UPI0005C47A39|nr:AraC family transcriptional regulator [Flammeovirga sp. OC4]